MSTLQVPCYQALTELVKILCNDYAFGSWKSVIFAPLWKGSSQCHAVLNMVNSGNALLKQYLVTSILSAYY